MDEIAKVSIIMVQETGQRVKVTRLRRISYWNAS